MPVIREGNYSLHDEHISPPHWQVTTHIFSFHHNKVREDSLHPLSR